GADRLTVFAHKDYHWSAADFIDYRILLLQGSDWISQSCSIDVYSDYEFALIQRRRAYLRRHRHAQHSFFPISGSIFSAGSKLFVRTKHARLRLFTFPGAKSKLVQKKRLEALALKRTKERFASHLLPPRARLFICHDAVRAVDIGEVNMR